MIVDKACFERGCACYDDRVDGPGVEVVEKTEKQEPVAWCVTYNGELTGNIFENKRIADLCKRNLEAKYGSEEDRKVVAIYTTPQPQRERVIFPTMLRKMWSGGEVQAWLDANVNKEKNQ